jgi:hypothetical protein
MKTMNLNLKRKLFLEPTLEDGGDADTAPFGTIQRPVDSW